MKIDPEKPDWAERDKLVMSKGHAGPAVYAALALKGFFPLDWLKTLNQPGTKLPSHCDGKLTPGIDMTTGSLGQGVSMAIGLALAQKMDELNSCTYLFTGDGELNEGQVWEGALFAPNHKLNNLIWFVDNNKKQLDGTTEEVLNLGDICAKFAAFNWHVQNIDGGDVERIYAAITAAKNETKRPSVIVLDTVKGAGAPLVEAEEFNHHMVFAGDVYEKTIAHLEKALGALG
jgi:transketolase